MKFMRINDNKSNSGICHRPFLSPKYSASLFDYLGVVKSEGISPIPGGRRG